MNEIWPWLMLALLGAFHGLNPAMGWLFAVALGMQEGNRAAVVRAFIPIALGHAVSVAVVVALVAVTQAFVSQWLLRLVGAGLLIAFGLYKLLAPMSHPRWVGMRVNFPQLTTWSFLMATAHGAGLMLVPLLFQLAGSDTAPSVQGAAHHVHISNESATAATAAMVVTEVGAVAVHTLAMFLVMGMVAIVVFEKIGLAILRRTWLNVDLVWAGALILAGVLTLVGHFSCI